MAKYEFWGFPDDIEIIPDGTAVHILGAKVGNEINESDPWLLLIEHIDSGMLARKYSMPSPYFGVTMDSDFIEEKTACISSPKVRRHLLSSDPKMLPHLLNVQRNDIEKGVGGWSTTALNTTLLLVSLASHSRHVLAQLCSMPKQTQQ